MAEFAERSWSVPVSGNVGLRVVSTQSGVSGYSQLDGGGTVPVETSSDYVDPLPSLNVTADLTDKLLLRLGLSKAMTRPSFSNLSPSVVLNTTFKTGTAGNPDLKPMYAKQADTSLEWYFQRNGLAYIDGFYKNVTGFIQNIAREEAQYDDYLILMPRNGSKGIIKGFEFGYQQFFGFLPAPLDGLGVQTNYTYVYSAAPSPVTDQIVPLEGLSPHSYNVAGIYEKYGISARVAYNWRDTYVQTTAGPGTGALPIFDAGGGELDASISYSLNTHFTVVATAVNLTRLRDETYYGTPSLPFSQSITDRRFGLGFRGKW
jgi:TonB-dependent receptor